MREFVAVIDGVCQGYVLFKQEDAKSPCYITGRITNLSLSSLHGFHIHQSGDLREGCESLCAHFNPFGTKHGAPSDSRKNRHVGDLGNIRSNKNGIAIIKIEDNIVNLFGKNSILGRSVIIHEGEDDLGMGGNELSLTTGNSGKRIGCGVIGLSKNSC